MIDDAELVHGSGAVQGRRFDWRDGPGRDDERVGVVARMYELIPEPRCRACRRSTADIPWAAYPWTCPGEGRSKCGEPVRPMRRWGHYQLSRAKGWSKSGLLSKIVVCEAVGPVRFDGWDASGEPVGRPVEVPNIRCFAASEDAASANTYLPAAMILSHLADSPWCRRSGYRIDPGTGSGERSTATHIYTPDGQIGRVDPMTSSGGSAEGSRSTFTTMDELWLWVARVMRELYATETQNIGKSRDAWAASSSTQFVPGQGSVAEVEAQDAADNEATDTYVDHRQADDDIDVWDDIDKRKVNLDRLETATRQAYGGAYKWAIEEAGGIEARARIFRKRSIPIGDLERKYLNRPAAAEEAYIPAAPWNVLADEDLSADWQPDAGEHIVLGFDGSQTDDHTGLVGVHVPTATLFVVKHWDPRDTPTEDWPGGRVDEEEVDDTVKATWAGFGVTRMYADPPRWQSWVAAWQKRHGSGVKPFETAASKRMTAALRAFRQAVLDGQLSHCGHPELTAHLLRAVLVTDAAKVRDSDAHPDGKTWRVAKPKQSSTGDVKIDLGVAAVLAWAAYLDTVAADEKPKKKNRGRAWSF
jgi:hypothetical protein